jgi:hypothetical protein
VEAVSEAGRMEEAADQHFGLRIFAADAGHIVAPRFTVVHVGHAIKLGTDFCKEQESTGFYVSGEKLFE